LPSRGPERPEVTASGVDCTVIFKVGSAVLPGSWRDTGRNQEKLLIFGHFSTLGGHLFIIFVVSD